MDIKKGDSALIIKEDGTVEFYIPRDDPDAIISDPSITVATLAIMITQGDKEFNDFMAQKADEYIYSNIESDGGMGI